MRVLHVGDDFAALRPCGLTFYSEALMRAQAAAGDEVAYVFSGRHYPLLRGPRLKRWSSRGVRMFELIGSPNHTHWETGTLEPERDLEEPVGEIAFSAALREAAPDLVHIQELARLPSSIIERAKDAGVPVVMTLHDYKPVCASVRLLDADGDRCTRREVGEDCARNCAGAPEGRAHLVELTLAYHRERVQRAVPLAKRIDFTAAGPLVGTATQLMMRASPASDISSSGRPNGIRPRRDAYQRRREVNLRRLSLCDRLIAPSPRVAEIYASLGVDRERVTVQRLTLPHLAELTPARGPEVRRPLTFVTLGGCSEAAKGSASIVEAVRRLNRMGRTADYRLMVLGHVERSAYGALSGTPNVDLRGPYDLADLGPLDQADMGLVPSIWEETLGFVGVEMLAKGLPLIGSALGGIPEYVRDGQTGWLNLSASGAELASLMARAIDEPSEVERLRTVVRALRGELVRPMDEHVAEVEALYSMLSSGRTR